jgi:SHS2 domain-containing protein
MMNEDQGLKFTSKAEVSDAIRALTAHTMKLEKGETNWALDKIKELTKLL